MNPENDLLSACRLALNYFEVQKMAGDTLDDVLLDQLDEQMLAMEPKMIPMLWAAITTATACQPDRSELLER